MKILKLGKLIKNRDSGYTICDWHLEAERDGDMIDIIRDIIPKEETQ